MRITLPTDNVRPFVVKKLHDLKEHVSEGEDELQRLQNNYQNRIDEYREMNWLKRFVVSKPEYDSVESTLTYQIRKKLLTDTKRQVAKLEKLLSTLEYTKELQLTDSDIRYYEIDLSKEGLQEVRESLST
ncbi:hypothetical protein P8918_13735 [Bacillus spizizenii]|nr:hypothetical protein [Bacillus spizizenii]MEC0842090.1 hypothetical protein [Bacillus spizizenii]